MKKDLLTLAWWLCCPLYLPAIGWLWIGFVLAVTALVAGMNWLADALVALAFAPIVWLEKLREAGGLK